MDGQARRGRIAVASAAAGVVSSVQAADAQRKSADYNKKVAENNAQAARMQAGFDAQRVREKNRRIAATQRAGLAKSGVSIVSGSAFDVLADQEAQGELDALTTLYRGRVQSTGFSGQAQYQDFVGKSAQEQGLINTGSSVLTGAAGVGGALGNLADVQAAKGQAASIQNAPSIEGVGSI